MARLKVRLIGMVAEDDRSLLPPGEDWQGIMARALSAGVMGLEKSLGGKMDEWRWDRIHQARPKHTLSGAFPDAADLLNPPPIPTSGDGDTPLAGSYSVSDPATVTGLSVVRYVFDASDNWSHSLWAVPLGSSGHPGSPHYHDQSETWRKVQLIPMQYDWETIKADSETQQKLQPA
jgi:penicillin amidase